jgi:hypothetical protein
VDRGNPRVLQRLCTDFPPRRLGIRITGGPIRGVAAPLHPDAELAHDVVMGLPWSMTGLLVLYSRTGEFPESPPAPRYWRVVHFVGGSYRLKVVSERRLDCVRRWCPVLPYPDTQTAAMLADRHAAWLAALDELRRRLAEVELRSFEIVDGDPAERAAARAA